MVRYAIEELLQLQNSPLAVKPPGLPPAEEWMGMTSEATRTKQSNTRGSETGLQDQTNRRPGTERHRSANPENIVLGPPKIAFASANPIRNPNKTFDSLDRPILNRDSESRDRFNFRRNDGDTDRLRDNRSRFKRGDGEEEGWSTVKPRKSFGADGAERFNNGRMGGERARGDSLSHGDTQRQSTRYRDRDDREGKDRLHRGFDLGREKDLFGDDTRRRDTGRARNEASWFNSDAPPTPRDRNSNSDKPIDRTRGWRDRDERPERASDRRWDRDKEKNEVRQEQDPEWMDEPADEKFVAHTADDFQKWKERMKASTGGTPAVESAPKPTATEGSFFGLEKLNEDVESPAPLVLDVGPDKFFTVFGKASADDTTIVTSKKEGPVKAVTMGKASRFTSFFSAPQEEQRKAPEPQLPPMSGLAALFQASKPQNSGNDDENAEEKRAFAQILQKLQSQGSGGSSSAPPMKIAIHPRPQEKPASPPAAPEIIHAYRTEQPQEPRPGTRHSQQQALQDLLAHRQNALSQPSSRPEQMLQDLVNQRQNASSSSSRHEPAPNRNAEFLMGLMQNSRTAPNDQLRVDMGMRMPPQPMQHIDEREQDIHQDGRGRRDSQRVRPPMDGPPGFFDEPAFLRGPQSQQHPPQPAQPHQQPQLDSSGRPHNQPPTQILQRPPPGLDQGLPGAPPGWAPPGNSIPPQQQQQRHIAPPPGLAGRGMPPVQQMFPPGFPGPMNGFPPPEAIPGMPRNMQPPPPGFFPPPGFMPPFGPPDAMVYDPFGARGAPPPGNFRRQ